MITKDKFDEILDLLETLNDESEELVDEHRLNKEVQSRTRSFLEACATAMNEELLKAGKQPADLVPLQQLGSARFRLYFDRLRKALPQPYSGNCEFDIALVPRALKPRGTSVAQAAGLRFGVLLSAQGKREEILRFLRSRFRPEFPPIQEATATTSQSTVQRFMSVESLREIVEAKGVPGLIADIGREMSSLYSAYGSGMPAVQPTNIQQSTEGASMVLDAVRNAFLARGLRYSDEEIAASYVALQTKGFLVLSGISGTGKTRLAQTWAEILLGPLDGDAPRRSAFVSVRPDWRDASSLLGYPDVLHGRYRHGPLSSFLVALSDSKGRDRNKPVDDEDSVAAVIAVLGSQEHRDSIEQRAKPLVARARELANQGKSREAFQLAWNSPEADRFASTKRSPATIEASDETLLVLARDLFDSNCPHDRAIAGMFRGLYPHPEEQDVGWVRMMRALTIARPEIGLPVTGGMIRKLCREIGREAIPLEKWVMAGKFDVLVQQLTALRRELNDRFCRPAGLDGNRNPLEVACSAWRIVDEIFGDDDVESDERELRSVSWDAPAFFFLDEMNLAHVEHYFADVLSVIESGFDPSDGRRKERLKLHDHASEFDTPGELELPRQVYVIGTVNADETTAAFSPKVLDRAFSMEIDSVDLNDYPGPEISASAVHLTDEQRATLVANFLRNGEGAGVTKKLVREAAANHGSVLLPRLRRLNDLLEPAGLHFGYRVVDEILSFVHLAASGPMLVGFTGSDRDARVRSAFDHAVRMKVLPKFHGPASRLEKPLERVIAWSQDPDGPPSDAVSIAASVTAVDLRERGTALRATGAAAGCALPRTARKALIMLAELKETGYTAFA